MNAYPHNEPPDALEILDRLHAMRELIDYFESAVLEAVDPQPPVIQLEEVDEPQWYGSSHPGFLAPQFSYSPLRDPAGQGSRNSGATRQGARFEGMNRHQGAPTTFSNSLILGKPYFCTAWRTV